MIEIVTKIWVVVRQRQTVLHNVDIMETEQNLTVNHKETSCYSYIVTFIYGSESWTVKYSTYR